MWSNALKRVYLDLCVVVIVVHTDGVVIINVVGPQVSQDRTLTGLTI